MRATSDPGFCTRTGRNNRIARSAYAFHDKPKAASGWRNLSDPKGRHNLPPRSDL